MYLCAVGFYPTTSFGLRGIALGFPGCGGGLMHRIACHLEAFEKLGNHYSIRLLARGTTEVTLQNPWIFVHRAAPPRPKGARDFFRQRPPPEEVPGVPKTSHTAIPRHRSRPKIESPELQSVTMKIKNAKRGSRLGVHLDSPGRRVRPRGVHLSAKGGPKAHRRVLAKPCGVLLQQICSKLGARASQ